MLVTGHEGKAHITPENWAELNRGIVGEDSCALSVGRKFEAELVSNNLLKIYDGCGVIQGRQIVTLAGQSEEVTIENGTQGEKRIDLVVRRYTKNADTKIENEEVVLIKGEPTEGTPQVPEHIEGNIRAGDLVADWPVYEIELDGINVVEVRPVFKVLMNADEVQKMVAELNDNKLEFGSYETASTPYTAPSDGFLFVNFNPTNSSVDVSIKTYDNANGLLVGYNRSQAGIAIAYSVPVIKGHTYRTTYQSGTLICRFVPAVKMS